MRDMIARMKLHMNALGIETNALVLSAPRVLNVDGGGFAHV
jgi:hypothetical protein